MRSEGKRDRRRRAGGATKPHHGRSASERSARRRDEGATASASCPHAPDCVGCPLVGTRYGEQLRRKQEAVRAALDAVPELRGVVLEEAFGSPRAFGYRNQAKLVFRQRRSRSGEREVLLGIYRPGTHSVAPAHGCAVHHRQLQPVLATLRTLVEQLGIPIFDERSRQGALRYALARTSVAFGETHLTLVSAVAAPPRLSELVTQLRRAEPGLRSLFLCVNPTPGNALLSPDLRRVFGPETLLERFGELDLESRPDAFVQANPAVAAKIYATAQRWLAPERHESLVDLYCGVGAIGLSLAPRAARVVGIEASAAAVACARANAARLGARNAHFVAADAARVGEILVAAGLVQPELAVVNPPRRGLGAGLVRAVVALGVSRLLYVSCDPRTLARDLGELVRSQFQVRKVRAFDMMPQTPHVEVVALLTRSPGAS